MNQSTSVRPRDIAFLAVLKAKMGNIEEAEKRIQLLNEQKESSRGDLAYQRARVLLHIGKKDLALKELENSISEGAKFYPFNVFENDPLFADIRNEADFLKVIFPYTQN